MHEGEGNTICLGDGVYVLVWSETKRRPVVQVYDPRFYFPVLGKTGSQDADHPTRASGMGYNVEARTYVRRLTFELGPTVWPRMAVSRTYPWGVGAGDNGEDVESDQTCYFTDATWP